MKPTLNLKRLAKFFALGSGFIIMLSTLFFTLFRIFEKITYDSISDLSNEFIMQIDSFTETINSSIVNYGMQLFYSNSVQTLMRAAHFSNTDRVYMVRDLNIALSSTDYAENIFVYNEHIGHVYSTDSAYPDQSVNELRQKPIRRLLLTRTNELRFKPIYCHEDIPHSKDYYTFMFYELNPNKTPKPGALIVTIKSGWYKKALLAASPSSDMIVIDQNGSILATANESIQNEYKNYYPSICNSSQAKSGYYVDKHQEKICIYYKSASTGHTYMKISSLEKMLPRLMYFRHTVLYIFTALVSVFGCVVIVFLFFALIPMLRMKDALKAIDNIQTGHSTDEPSNSSTSRSLQNQIAAVISRSERNSLEQIFYDMLASKQQPDPRFLFQFIPQNYMDSEIHFGLTLVLAQHRQDIYESVCSLHPEILTTKSAHVYACIGLYESNEDFEEVCALLTRRLSCRCFASELFDDFASLVQHYAALNELHKLSLVLNPQTLLIHEQALNDKILTNTITSKDFTDLIVCLKSGNLEASRAKWKEILDIITNYRYENFQYILNRTEDTICKVLRELPSASSENTKKLLPESLEQIQSLEEINNAFFNAFEIICANYIEKKAEKYSELAQQIKNLVQQDYHDSNLNSQFIADRINMNNAYLGRIFKSSYGRSINDYINTCRIEETIKLLKTTNLPVSEIAQQVGFSNIKYFYVLFKKATGITPAKFRSSNTDEPL